MYVVHFFSMESMGDPKAYGPIVDVRVAEHTSGAAVFKTCTIVLDNIP